MPFILNYEITFKVIKKHTFLKVTLFQPTYHLQYISCETALTTSEFEFEKFEMAHSRFFFTGPSIRLWLLREPVLLRPSWLPICLVVEILGAI